ncbi:MAG: signal peptidase I [Verrucomicrobiia bacterium]
MFGFFTPRHLREGRAVLKGAQKIFRYKRDLLSQERVVALRASMGELKEALRTKDRARIKHAQGALEKEFGTVPGAVLSPLQENVEVIIVAVVLALGLRAYIVQPFKIPTGSMQPTLNGIIAYASEEPMPALPVRWFQSFWNGRSWYDVRAASDETVLAVRETKHLFFFTRTIVRTDRNRYELPIAADVLMRQVGVRVGRFYQAGDVIARGYVETGDQVFVDKISYHFVPPRRGEVFVFKTNSIAGIRIEPGMGAQHYIKRLTGLPGDELRIDPPRLYVNGELPKEPSLLRVIEARNGYRGYSNGGYDERGRFTAALLLSGAETRFRVPPRTYFAMGDNSFNSYDSRGWGPVPERNLVGRGFFVWWPFNARWGVIH